MNQFGVFVGDYITNSLTNGLEMINQTAQRAEKEVSFEKSSEISSSLIKSYPYITYHQMNNVKMIIIRWTVRSSRNERSQLNAKRRKEN